MIAVSSKILHLTAVSFQPSLPNASDSAGADPAFSDVLQDVELKSKTLSSVLHKLYLWEKKLYEEVKVHYLIHFLAFELLFLYYVVRICEAT